MTATPTRASVWLLLRLLAALPLPVAHALGTLLGELLYWLPNGLKQVARTNLALCFPEWDEGRRRRLLRRSLHELGKGLTELGALWLWSPERVLAMLQGVDGAEHLGAVEGGAGVIMATPHLGAWELAGLWGGHHYRFTTLYRPLRVPALESLIRTARERTGARLVAATPRGVKALFQALSEGRVLGLLPDQDPGRGAGVLAPFFGVPANTMTLFPRLVQRQGARVVLGYAERLPRGRGYRIHLRPVPPGMDDPDPRVACAALNRGVEACVRERPEQYLWVYKRFKTRPPGEPGVY